MVDHKMRYYLALGGVDFWKHGVGSVHIGKQHPPIFTYTCKCGATFHSISEAMDHTRPNVEAEDLASWIDRKVAREYDVHKSWSEDWKYILPRFITFDWRVDLHNWRRGQE